MSADKRAKYKPHGKIMPKPVLTEIATMIFGVLVQDADVWEYGSGGSTLWLAERAASVISIEDDPDWHLAVATALSARGLTNAEVRLIKTCVLPDAIKGTGVYDVVFVDCLTQEERRRAVILGAKHIKPGGWLVADDYTFPKTNEAVERLRTEGWDVAVVSGIKNHPIRQVPVRTATAFCHKPN